MPLRLAVDAGDPRAGEEAVPPVPDEGTFRVGVAHERGGVRVRPIGEIDTGSIGRLRERTNEVMAAGPSRLVLDLRATTFLDSSGLHLVLEMDTWAAATGAEFMIISGPRAIRLAFDAAGLSARLPLVDGAQYAAHAAAFSPR